MGRRAGGGPLVGAARIPSDFGLLRVGVVLVVFSTTSGRRRTRASAAAEGTTPSQRVAFENFIILMAVI